MCVIGLPLRGQAHIAKRLQHYLDFFHGTHTEMFNVNDFVGTTNGDEALLEALREHFEHGDKEKQKHAILYTTNAWLAARSQWSGHSKSRRRWMKNALEAELQAELYLVELVVNDALEHHLKYIQTHHLTQEDADIEQHIRNYSKRFVTIQEDGTEDDLGYIKVVDYNKKVVTNNMMMTFLGSRVARFLGNVHPYSHHVFLARCGESEYTAGGKIGGDSGLSERGHQFSLRLAEFADAVVCKQASDFACVSLTAFQARRLSGLLATRPDADGVMATGRWDEICSSEDEACSVKEGMLLTRILPDGASEFQDAPASVADVLRLVGSGRPATLVFVDPAPGNEEGFEPACRLWTSAMLRAKQTVANFPKRRISLPDGKVDWQQLGHREYRNLNDLYHGEYEGLTAGEIAARRPMEAALRGRDKLGYRYPRGESYLDVIARLDDTIQQLESYQEPVMIVAHPAVLRLLYAYFTGIAREQAPDLDIPNHTVVYFRYDGTSAMVETRYTLGPACPHTL